MTGTGNIDTHLSRGGSLWNAWLCLSVVISPLLRPGEAGCGPRSPVGHCPIMMVTRLHVSIAEALLVLEPGQLGRVPRPRLVHVGLEALAPGARARDV